MCQPTLSDWVVKQVVPNPIRICSNCQNECLAAGKKIVTFLTFIMKLFLNYMKNFFYEIRFRFCCLRLVGHSFGVKKGL